MPKCKNKATQYVPSCEGYRRKGGAFTFGPPRWIKCENDATATIEFKQGNEDIATLPACTKCWNECIENKDIAIISVKPIKEKEIT